METKYRQERSLNGLRLDVLKSGLQKYIRRGETEKALFCAGELFLFSETGEEGKRIVTNFKHRLMVILLEDVCNWAIIPSCFTAISEFTEENCIRAVMVMCASDKARICSHARAVFTASEKLISENLYLQKIYQKIDTSDTNLEGWCARFSESFDRRDLACVFYAFKIHASKEVLKKTYKRRSKPQWFIFSIIGNELFENMFLELQNLRESFLCWLVPLLRQLKIIPSKSKIGKITEPDCLMFSGNRAGIKIEMDEFVFDKHTREGKSRGREQFIHEGAQVFPEASFIVPEWKAIYEGDSFSFPRETSEYEFIARAQLVTRRTGQDVYFAKDKTGKIVVVKGPFMSPEGPRRAIALSAWKKDRDLPYIEYKLVQLVADRWPEGTALGARNSVNRAEPQWFMICPSFIDDFPLKEKKSKLWPPTQVVSFDQNFHLNFDAISETEMTDYVLNLIMRFKFGVGDLADRNFIRHGGRIYSIDEESKRDKPISMMAELKKNRCAAIAKWIRENYKKNLEKKTDLSKEDCVRLFE